MCGALLEAHIALLSLPYSEVYCHLQQNRQLRLGAAAAAGSPAKADSASSNSDPNLSDSVISQTQ